MNVAELTEQLRTLENRKSKLSSDRREAGEKAKSEAEAPFVKQLDAVAAEIHTVKEALLRLRCCEGR